MFVVVSPHERGTAHRAEDDVHFADEEVGIKAFDVKLDAVKEIEVFGVSEGGWFAPEEARIVVHLKADVVPVVFLRSSEKREPVVESMGKDQFVRINFADGLVTHLKDFFDLWISPTVRFVEGVVCDNVGIIFVSGGDF
mgnify:CR=1 FL=1